MLTAFIVLAVYIAGVIVFATAIYKEAPKHQARLGAIHLLVAFVWPLWLVYYAIVLLKEKI